MAGRMCFNLSNGTDVDTIKRTGAYYIGPGTNLPSNFFYFIVLDSDNTEDIVQFGFSLTKNTFCVRYYLNGSWRKWMELTLG